MSQKKPTFMDIKLKHGMNLGDIEEEIGPPMLADAMYAPLFRILHQLPIDRWQTEKIISACNKLYGTQYTLDDLDIKLYESGED